MTRKDYQSFADIMAGEVALARHLSDAGAQSMILQSLRAVTLSWADVCKRDNGRFDRAKFYVACGFTEDGSI